MNRFTKLFAIVGACALTISFAACGSSGGNSSPDAGSSGNFDAGQSNPDAGGSEADAAPPDASVADCSDCVEEAACDDSGEVAVCTCPEFFEGDGTVAGTGCTAIVADECADGTDDCGDALCVDAEIGFSCHFLAIVSPYDGELVTANPTALLAGDYDNPETELTCDGLAIQRQVPLTEDGNVDITIDGATGLATHPETGAVFIVYTEGGNRFLGTVDVSTGVITKIGDLVDRVSALTFDNDANLFASVGDGGTTSESIWLVDQATAELTLVVDVDAGSDGSIVGFNPADGFLYHLSGRDSNPGADLIDVTIDDTDPLNVVITADVTTVTRNGFNFDEPFSMFPNWPTNGTMGVANLDQELIDVTFDSTDIAAPTLDALQVPGFSTGDLCNPGPSEAPNSIQYFKGIALVEPIVLLADGEACTGNFECEGVCDTVGSNQCEPVNSCGNGILEGVEVCDDGNTDDGDGCEGDCGVVLLADGETCGIDYECMNVCDSIGSNTCEPADTCGNGNLETGEECDDGNATAGDGCSELCAIEV